MSKAPKIEIGPDLRELAERNGLLLGFEAAGGTAQAASEDAVRAVLAALGIPAQNAKEVRAALIERRDEEARRVIEPVVVVRCGEASSVPLTLPATAEPAQSWVVVEHEDGRIGRHRLSDLFTASGSERRGLLDFGRLEALEPGYHALAIEAPRLVARSRLLATPRCPVPARAWGAFMPLHALRSEHDWGIGSYRDLADLAEWVAGRGGGFVGGLPLYPIADRPPIDPSPYLPVSRLAYNEFYLDPGASPELATAPEARRLLDSTETQREVARLRTADLVDYAGVATLKRRIGEALSAALTAQASERRDAFTRFGAAHPELVAYARFRAEQEGASSAAGSAVVQYHLYTQWLASEQLAAAASTGAPLYGDLPVGVRSDGFDPRWKPESFVSGVHGGAPPDTFFDQGQNWGFSPLHPERMRKDGYHYLIECLRRACRHADILRIDHVAGLQRLYWIAEGMDATDGVYVRYRSDELHAVVCIEADRSNTAIVGEDLGTVPESVRSAMTRDNMLRSWVLQFETSATEPFPEPPRPAMASWATHDLPRFSAYFEGVELVDDTKKSRAAWRRAVRQHTGETSASAGAVLGAILQRLAGGPADLVLVDLEELWGEEEPQNRPGTGPDEANWCRRSAVTLEEMRDDPIRPRLLSTLSRLRHAETAAPSLEAAAS